MLTHQSIKIPFSFLWYLMICLSMLTMFFGCNDQEDIPFQDAIDDKLINEYFDANGITGAVKTESGLYYEIIDAGGSNKPTLSDTLSILFVGRLLNGDIFDSTLEDDEPSELLLANTVKGFQEGMQLIGKGGHIVLYMPSSLGFGSSSQGLIPPNAVIIFSINLLDFY